MPDDERPKSIMQSLGEFVGHITHAVKTKVPDPASPPPPPPPPPSSPNDRTSPAPGSPKVHSRQETQERTVYTPDSKMVLRRTIIEEVEVRPHDPPSNDETTRS